MLCYIATANVCVCVMDLNVNIWAHHIQHTHLDYTHHTY